MCVIRVRAYRDLALRIYIIKIAKQYAAIYGRAIQVRYASLDLTDRTDVFDMTRASTRQLDLLWKLKFYSQTIHVLERMFHNPGVAVGNCIIAFHAE